jgi:hypothetical protein
MCTHVGPVISALLEQAVVVVEPVETISPDRH